MADAVEGKGVDRHFLGLKSLIKDGEETPELFKDPSCAFSCHWFISTSQVTSEYFDSWGWGEVVPDGYGVPYMIKEDSIHFNVSSRHLKSNVLCHYLMESLDEMKAIFPSVIKAKL